MTSVYLPSVGAAKPSSRPPCVLVITNDYSNMIEVRVRVPFDAMYRAGVIRGYHILNKGQIVRSIGLPGDIKVVDVIWVQRMPMYDFLLIMSAFCGRFVYDVDDNFFISPSYNSRGFEQDVQDMARSLLLGAKVVSVSNRWLLGALGRAIGIELGNKGVVSPNVAEDVYTTPRVDPPQALIIASSGRLPLTSSKGTFLTAVADFISRVDIPLIGIGVDPAELAIFGSRLHHVGMLDYFTYREFLKAQNAMAVAPLETNGDAATTAFVRGKSDVKMVEFGSCGIPAVYSDVEPYKSSDLKAGPLVDMGDPVALKEALQYVYTNAQRIRLRASEQVRRARLAFKASPESWAVALDRGRLPLSISLSDVLDFERRLAALRLSPERQLQLSRDHVEVERIAGPIPFRIPPPIQLESTSDLGADYQADALFDEQFYLATYPDVRDLEIAPLAHYKTVGIAERRNPNPFFDTGWYVSRNPEAGLPGEDPLNHYVSKGILNGADPSPRFSGRLYTALNPSAVAVNPLAHLLGRLRGRRREALDVL